MIGYCFGYVLGQVKISSMFICDNLGVVCGGVWVIASLGWLFGWGSVVEIWFCFMTCSGFVPLGVGSAWVQDTIPLGVSCGLLCLVVCYLVEFHPGLIGSIQSQVAVWATQTSLMLLLRGLCLSSGCACCCQ